MSACFVLLVGCHQAGPGPAEPAAPERAAAGSWEGFVPSAGPIIVGHVIKPGDMSSTELKFGIAPKRIPGIVYQDGIVLMEGGDKAIRAVDSNGVGWTLNANAPRVDELAVGKIIFATGRCVGRILALQREGADVKLVLGPIQLTDIIKHGNFSYDQPVDLQSMIAVDAPEYPGAPNSTAAQQMAAAEPTVRNAGHPGYERHVRYFAVSPGGEWTPLRTGAQGDVAHRADTVWRPRWEAPSSMHTDFTLPGVPGVKAPGLPAGFGEIAKEGPPTSVQMTNGAQLYTCSFDCGGLGLKLYQQKDGVQVWINAIVHLLDPHLTFHLSIASDASVNAQVTLSGAAGLSVGFDAAAGKDFTANLKEVGAVPLSVTIPLGGLGVPLTASFSQNLNLDTAFSAKTSVLHALGEFNATGSISMTYIGGQWHIPPLKVALKNTLAGAISGVSVGINSLVFAVDQRLLVGVGTLGFATGPYVNLISSITALKQASQAWDCRQATFGMSLGGGIGYEMPKVVAKIINFFLGLIHVAPVPASSYIVKLKGLIPLVDLKDSVPQGCAG